MKMNQIQKEVLVGILLGDASLIWNSKKTKASLALRQKNKDYLDHLCSVFGDFITASPTKNAQTGVWQCNTRSFPQFRFYKHQFYTKENKKGIPDLIHKWLTPRVLAYWYMDDGSQKWKNHSSGVKFCTDCFPDFQVKKLAKTITDLYGIQTSTFRQRNTLRIYISGRGTNGIRFGELILPYIYHSMMYKIPEPWKKPDTY